MAATNEPTLSHVLGALKREYNSLLTETEARGPAFLEAQSFCTNWKNYQVTSHLGSGSEIFQRTLEAALDGKEALSDEGRKAIWAHFDSLGATDVYAEFKDRAGKLLAYVDAVPASQADAIVPTFAGALPLPKALLTRLNEMALHVWDVRVTLDPTLTLDAESAALLLGSVVDRLPNRAKADGIAELGGKAISFDVQGDAAQQITLRPGTDKPTIEAGLASDTLFSVRISAEAFQRLVSGRLPIAQAVSQGLAAVSGAAERAAILDKIFPGY